MRRPEIIVRIKDALRKIIPDARIVLYGSEARGEATVESDIDLLILLEGDKDLVDKERSIKTILCDIELDMGVLINSIIIPRARWENRPFKTPFYVNVMNEGILL